MTKSNISKVGILAFFLTIVFSCSKETNSYEITGKLDNLSGNYFLLSRESADSLIIDTISVSDKGEFSYKGLIDTLTEVSLFFNQNTKTTYLLVDKGWKVELKGDALYPDLIEIKGGDVNNDLSDFKEKNKALLKKRADIAAASNDSLGLKDYVVELKNINFELSNIAASYIAANPDKIASVMLINTFFKDETSVQRLDENLGLLRGSAASFPLTFELKHFSEMVKKSSIGAMAPAFSLKDSKGKLVNLSDYRGKYVSLMFMSSTCKGCLMELEEAIEIYDKIKKGDHKAIEFISIVKDTEEKALIDSLSSAVKWPIIPVQGGWSAKLFEDYYIREIPYNILISPSGTILERDYVVLSLSKSLFKFDLFII